MKVGLCIGGGGARGFAGVEIIRGVLDSNIEISRVSGCSIGSIIGAYFCLYGEVESLNEVFDSFTKRNWFSLIDLNNPVTSMIQGKKIRKFLEKIFEDKTFDDLKIPLTIVSTNFTTKKAEYFERGLLVDAIMASISIPGIFEPYKIGEDFYIDGGVCDNIPFNCLFEKGMNKVIAVDFVSNGRKNLSNPKRAFDVLITSFGMLLDTSKPNFTHIDNLFVFKPKFKGDFTDVLKFYNSKEYLEAGKVEFLAKRVEFLKFLEN